MYDILIIYFTSLVLIDTGYLFSCPMWPVRMISVIIYWPDNVKCD